MAKTEHNAQNIFNITQPELYRCQLYHYHSKLSRLYLRIFKGQMDTPVFFLLFSDVGYIDCPINWQGANFCTAQREMCIQLMLETGLIGQAILQFPNAYASITDYARLYQVQTPSRLIQIVASSASLLQQPPPL